MTATARRLAELTPAQRKTLLEGMSAADLLRRVVNPNDGMRINGACVQMGWRKATKAVVGRATEQTANSCLKTKYLT